MRQQAGGRQQVARPAEVVVDPDASEAREPLAVGVGERDRVREPVQDVHVEALREAGQHRVGRGRVREVAGASRVGIDLREGERIEIRGFGSFQVKVREAREGRNPKTGEPVHISAKRTPFFKVGKELKEMVDDAPSESKADDADAE